MSSKSKLYLAVIIIMIILSIATTIYKSTLENDNTKDKVESKDKSTKESSIPENTVVPETTEIPTSTAVAETKKVIKVTPSKVDEVLIEYTSEVRNFKKAYIKAFNENNTKSLGIFVVEGSPFYKELDKIIKKNNKKIKIDLVDLKINKYENKNDGNIILHTTEKIKTGNDTKEHKYTYVVELEMGIIFVSMKEVK